MRILGLLLTALALVAVGFAAGERTSRRDAIPRAEWKQRIQAALVEDDPLAQADTLAAILHALGPDDLEVALEAYEDSFARGGGGRQSFELLMEAWSRIDAAGAFVRVNTWPTDYQRLALPARLQRTLRVVSAGGSHRRGCPTEFILAGLSTPDARRPGRPTR